MGCTPTEVAGRRLAAAAYPPRLLPLGGSCRRKATEGAWNRGNAPVRVGCRPGKKPTIPNALQLPLPSGTTCQLPPPLGEEALGWVLPLGNSQPKRLPCARGAVAVRRLRGCTWRGMLRTILPSALRAATSLCTREARGGGFYRRLPAKPLVTCLFSYPSAHANPELGMQRNQLQRPPAGPHRDDRERRQIPVPIFGAA